MNLFILKRDLGKGMLAFAVAASQDKIVGYGVFFAKAVLSGPDEQKFESVMLPPRNP